MPRTTASLPSLMTRRPGPGSSRCAEALARAAELRVDVVLQAVHVLRLLAAAGHLVAGVLLERVELAQRAVLDQVVAP